MAKRENIFFCLFQSLRSLSPSRSSTPVSVNSTWSTLSPSSSFEEDALADSQMADFKPPPLKRTKPREYSLTPPKNERRTLLGKDFKIAISDAVKKCIEKNSFLDDVSRRQLIRDCVTCLKAHSGEHLTGEHFTEAAQLLCKEVPVMRDEKPPLWPEDVEFEYWVSSSV